MKPMQTSLCSRALIALTAGAISSACGARSPLITPDVGTMSDAGSHADVQRVDLTDPPDVVQSPTGVDNLGRDFWSVTAANSQLDPSFTFAVVISNPQSDAVSVHIEGGTLASPIDQNVDPSGVATIVLPWVRPLVQFSDVHACGGAPCPATSALVHAGAYHITSTAPVAVYQFNPLHYRTGDTFSYTNDASTLLPAHGLSTHYLVATFPNWRPSTPGLGDLMLGGFAVVVAAEPGSTTVHVNSSAMIRSGPGVERGNGTRTVILHQGDALQLVGDIAGEDLTGTTIDADHPVAVFIGHDCTNVPSAQPACDHLEEQLIPVDTWGREAVVTQFRDRTAAVPFMVRIVSADPNNQLAFDPGPLVPRCQVIGQAQVCDVVSSSPGFLVYATSPFLALQSMTGQGDMQAECAGNNPPDLPECMGDPALVTEVPVEQYRRRFDFLVPDTYVRNLVNVVAPIGTSVRMDDAPLAGDVVDIGSRYRMYFARVQPGTHHIAAADGVTAIGIKVYGVAQYTSYAYPGGMGLSRLTGP